jgi:molecular chaperone IbpA
LGSFKEHSAHNILLNRRKSMTNQLSHTNLLNRAFIGFDSVFNALEKRSEKPASSNYPPYNIIKIDETNYVIELAATGFSISDILITVENNTLKVKGVHNESNQSVNYMYHGLSSRNFTKEFPLAEHVQVISASAKNGMLSVNLQKVMPESSKPKVIDILELK